MRIVFVSAIISLGLLAGIAQAQQPAPQPPSQQAPDAVASDPNTGALPPQAPVGSTRQTVPAKFSPENAALDKLPIMAFPIPLSEAEKRQVYDAAVANENAPVRKVPGALSTQLPSDVDMAEFPPNLVAAVPAIAGYKYVRLPDRIILVSPANRIVVGEIAR
jgi:hypothetical protein